MPELNAQTIISALSSVNYQDTDTSFAELLVSEPLLKKDEKGYELDVDFSVPVSTQAAAIAEHLSALDEQIVAVNVGCVVPARPALNFGQQVAGVKNVIAVASGKGGVGKSTTSVNLALALAKEGARVGLLDADIYGPSQTHMLDLEGQRPSVKEGNRIVPFETMGIQSISMGNLVTDKTPMVWRGPMASGALQQLLLNTDWDNVDYLIIDMPPGTGDIPLTLSQKVPVTGAVIVTTPQDIALLDAKKGIEMFNKVNVPVLGVVENMAVHICSQCGHAEHIFGEQGGSQLAGEYGVPMLGALPLALSIRQQTDAGRPSVYDNADSEISGLYRCIARKVATAVAFAASGAPEIEISEE